MRTLTRATVATLMLVCLTVPLQAQSNGSIMPDVVYGHKAGMALTFDVFMPTAPNGAGILNMVSGGWVSRWRDPAQAPAGYQAPLAQGFPTGSDDFPRRRMVTMKAASKKVIGHDVKMYSEIPLPSTEITTLCPQIIVEVPGITVLCFS